YAKALQAALPHDVRVVAGAGKGAPAAVGADGTWMECASSQLVYQIENGHIPLVSGRFPFFSPGGGVGALHGWKRPLARI
ncbi:MAG TPA: hypothetical protein VLZ89_00445, partial [Anaerolineales bacterium]|nr:hypothetical protein [Anaerolineales bacterium]